MTPTEPDRIEPDTKDWTFVITDGCAECGFEPSFDVASTGALLRDSLPRWRARLAADDIHVRPAQDVWSPLEYGLFPDEGVAHVARRAGASVAG